MNEWKQNLLVCWFGVFAVSSGMSQIVPILPLYVEQLGVHGMAEIAQWSGWAFGINFISLAVFSPIWGKAADKYGRKPMLLRASLWLSVIVTCMGFAQNVYQLVALRMLQGALAGFISAAITMVAVQTPLEHSGWALGTLSTASVGGTLLGPLLGGFLSDTLGMRSVFLFIGVLSLIAFFLTLLFVREKFTRSEEKSPSFLEVWRLLPDHRLIVAMFVTTFVMSAALMSVQPIITVYITQLVQGSAYIALISGAVFASSGLASILAASWLGSLSDRIGPPKVMFVALIASGLLFLPQAFVQTAWQLGVLRFMIGLATAGLLPAINSLIKRNTPDTLTGRTFGYNQSAQFLGAFGGSVFGGTLAALFGVQSVFLFTGVLLLANAAWVYRTVYRPAGQ